MIRVFSAASDEMVEASHFRISAWTSCACSVEATLPVPMALSHERDEKQFELADEHDGILERGDVTRLAHKPRRSSTSPW